MPWSLASPSMSYVFVPMLGLSAPPSLSDMSMSISGSFASPSLFVIPVPGPGLSPLSFLTWSFPQIPISILER